MGFIFNKALVVGLGLIGGSFALACKDRSVFKQIVGLTRSLESKRLAVELGIVDSAYLDIEDAIDGVDFVFVSIFPEDIADFVISLDRYTDKKLLVTDAGSIKEEIVDKIESAKLSNIEFVGGHPIAGTEKFGPSAAFKSLYEDRYTILTPCPANDISSVETVKKIWEMIGSKVVLMNPKEHDEALSLISHLPHMLAYSLVDTLDKADQSSVVSKMVAGGFKSMTRIAASNPRMWIDIFKMNRKSLIRSADCFETSFSAMKEMLISSDFEKLEDLLLKIQKVKLKLDMNG